MNTFTILALLACILVLVYSDHSSSSSSSSADSREYTRQPVFRSRNHRNVYRESVRVPRYYRVTKYSRRDGRRLRQRIPGKHVKSRTSPRVMNPFIINSPIPGSRYSKKEPELHSSQPQRCSEPRISCYKDSPYRTVDGSCNNLKYPSWGMAGSHFQRWIQPYYDGRNGSPQIIGTRGLPRPSPRILSTKYLQLSTEDDEDRNGSTMMVAFGQFVDHDTDLTRGNEERGMCCENGRPVYNQHKACFNVEIPYGDSHFKNDTCLDFVRSQGETCSGQREQINNLTSFIDASNVYGSGVQEAVELRLFSGGRLKENQFQGSGELPYARRGERSCTKAQQSSCYMTGDHRANEWAGLTAMHTIFLREHNRIADILYKKFTRRFRYTNIDLDELSYQETKRIITAQLQVIIYKEWLPKILPNSLVQKYGFDIHTPARYDPSINPTIANVFATAAFRFAHSMIPDGIQPLDYNYAAKQPFKSLDDMSRQPVAYQQMGHDSIVRGLVRGKCQRFDKKYVTEIRDKLFTVFFEGRPIDLISFNIQRGRDHGLAPYTAWRQYCGLGRAYDFEDLHDHTRTDIEALKKVYDHVDDIDLFVGGTSEKRYSDGMIGPTFGCLLAKQFTNLKHGDRYWFENTDTYAQPFTSYQINNLKQVTLAKVLCENTDIDRVNEDVFDVNGRKVSCATIPGLDMSLW